jgi:hypothetical protein
MYDISPNALRQDWKKANSEKLPSISNGIRSDQQRCRRSTENPLPL